MSRFFTILVILVSLNSFGQTTQYMLINNLVSTSDNGMDLEFFQGDSSIIKVPGIKYHGASESINVPTSTILTLKIFHAGTTKLISFQQNVVFTNNRPSTAIIFGTSSVRYILTSNSLTPPSDATRYKFFHTTPTLEKVNLRIREPLNELENDFDYGDATFSFNNIFAADDYILDLVSYKTNDGLFAYEYPGSKLGGQYVFFYTSGTQEDNDMYMVESNGTTTKLKRVNRYILSNTSISDTNIKCFPNPVSNYLTIESNQNINKTITVSIIDALGRTLRKSIQIGIPKSIDFSAFPNGIYYVRMDGNGFLRTFRIIKI